MNVTASDSSANRNAISSVLQGMLLIGAMLRIPLMFRESILLYARPFIEDAYYTLSVARSLGTGEGLTINGIVTNGFQPLIAFLYAPFFSIFHEETALRMCLLLAIAIEFMLVFTAMRFTAKMSGTEKPFHSLPALIVGVLLLWSYSTTVYSLNGLETALAAWLALASVCMYTRAIEGHGSSIYRWAIPGIFMGFAVLARIDVALLVVVVACYHLFTKNGTMAKRTIEAAVFSGTAFLVSAPWWVYNFVSFGSIMPTSGQALASKLPIGENLVALVHVLLNDLLLIGYIPYQRTLVPVQFVLLGAIAAGILLIVFIPRWRQWAVRLVREIRERYKLRMLAPLFLFQLVLAAYYVFRFGAPHFLSRYLFLLHILLVILAALVAAGIFARLVSNSPKLTTAIVVTGLAVLAGVYAYPYSWYYSTDKARQNDFLQAALYIQEHIPENEKVGMGQSGTAAFFNPHVTNLDGKVNYDAHLARERGEYCAYIDSAGFEYLIDWEDFFSGLEPCNITERYGTVDTVGRFIVKRRSSGTD